MMFASKAQPDRFPYRVGEVRVAYQGTIGGVPTVEDPRSYDPAMNNPPNPILLEFRQAWNSTRDDWKIRQAEFYLSYLNGDVYDWREFQSEVFEHARKVLTRLANLEAS